MTKNEIISAKPGMIWQVVKYNNAMKDNAIMIFYNLNGNEKKTGFVFKIAKDSYLYFKSKCEANNFWGKDFIL